MSYFDKLELWMVSLVVFGVSDEQNLHLFLQSALGGCILLFGGNFEAQIGRNVFDDVRRTSPASLQSENDLSVLSCIFVQLHTILWPPMWWWEKACLTARWQRNFLPLQGQCPPAVVFNIVLDQSPLWSRKLAYTSAWLQMMCSWKPLSLPLVANVSLLQRVVRQQSPKDNRISKLKAKRATVRTTKDRGWSQRLLLLQQLEDRIMEGTLLARWNCKMDVTARTNWRKTVNEYRRLQEQRTNKQPTTTASFN